MESVECKVWSVSQSLHKHVPVLLCTTKLAQTRSSTTVYYKACTNTFQYYPILQNSHKHVPVLLCTTKLTQTRSSTTDYCVLQSLHKHVPVLLCTTKLAQSRSQYYCVLQSLHKQVPVLLCTTKLAQTRSSTVVLCTTQLAQTRSSTTVHYAPCSSTFQYYCVLQRLHKHTSLPPFRSPPLPVSTLWSAWGFLRLVPPAAGTIHSPLFSFI